MEFYVGQILLLPYGFAPQYSVDCDGRLLSIQQNNALFSLLGVTYGGDGRTTFGVPDLRGCAPVGIGQKPGLSMIQLGQTAGTESVTLTQANMPAHAHPFSNAANVSVTPKASPNSGSTTNPANAVWANSTDGSSPLGVFTAPTNNDPSMAALTGTAQIAGNTGVAGANTAVGIRNPYLGLRYVIMTQGIYPQRP